MSIKAVFLDFDYTIYSHKMHCIPKSTMRSLHILHEKGIKLILATGRDKLEMSIFPEYKEIPFDGFIMLNGQLCIDKNGNKLFDRHFKGESLDALLELFNEKTMPIVFVEEDNLYINKESELVEIANGEIATLRHKVGVYTGNPLYLAVAYIKKDEEEALLARLPCCGLQRWGEQGVDIVCKGTDKTKGMEVFLTYFGLKREECMALGDSFNDIGMIQYAGIGIAMGNGVPEAKENADFVTKDIDDDGIEFALKSFNLT